MFTFTNGLIRGTVLSLFFKDKYVACNKFVKKDLWHFMIECACFKMTRDKLLPIINMSMVNATGLIKKFNSKFAP